MKLSADCFFFFFNFSASPGASQCTECPEGFYCPENSTDYASNPCPAGYYCPNGTLFDTQYPCDIGYYNPNTGQKSIQNCLPCPAGKYCAMAGMSTWSGDCDAGWYCILGAWSARPTEIGNYSAPDCFCPNNQTGGQCTAGYFCPMGSSAPTPCTGGEMIFLYSYSSVYCHLKEMLDT